MISRLYPLLSLVVVCFVVFVSGAEASNLKHSEMVMADTVSEGDHLNSDVISPSSAEFVLVSSPIKEPKITSAYGMRRHPINGQHSFHNGVDLISSNPLVMCVYGGKVVEVGEHTNLGRFVRVDHGGVFSIYGHLSACLVEIGDFMRAGEVIGLMGQTGRATGMHLHFSLRIGTRYVDPLKFLLLLQETLVNK